MIPVSACWFASNRPSPHAQPRGLGKQACYLISSRMEESPFSLKGPAYVRLNLSFLQGRFLFCTCVTPLSVRGFYEFLYFLNLFLFCYFLSLFSIPYSGSTLPQKNRILSDGPSFLVRLRTFLMTPVFVGDVFRAFTKSSIYRDFTDKNIFLSFL